MLLSFSLSARARRRPAGLAGMAAVTPAASAAPSGPAASIPEVLAWGGNFYGELGNGTTTDNDEPEGVHLPAGTTYTVVRCGLSAFAVSKGGRLYGWGNNAAGQLGDGTATEQLTPVRVKLPAGVKITSVRAGGDFSLARTSTGGLCARGDNSLGELGNGSTTSRLR